MENNTPIQQTTTVPEKRPNETGSVNVAGFLKIYDPSTRKVFVEQKDD